MATRERITKISTYDSAANNGAGSWNEAVPIGAETDNIDISSTINNGGDGIIPANSSLSSGVIVTSGDTATKAWGKFNTFVKRVGANLTGALNQAILNVYNPTANSSNIYSAEFLNNYFNNIIGYMPNSEEDPTLYSIINDKVGKTGSQTMEGSLFISRPNVPYLVLRNEQYYAGHPQLGSDGKNLNSNEMIYFRGANPPSTATDMVKDANLGGIYHTYTGGKASQTKMFAQNFQDGAKTSEAKLNQLTLAMSNAGVPSVILSDGAAAPWRKALELGSSTGAFPITIAQGGTGSTGTTLSNTISDIVTPNTTNKITISSAVAATWGKVVMLRCQFTCTENRSGGTYIGTLASAYRPKIQAMVNGGANATDNNIGFINAYNGGDAGQIYYYGSLVANRKYYIWTTYICN